MRLTFVRDWLRTGLLWIAPLRVVCLATAILLASSVAFAPLAGPLTVAAQEIDAGVDLGLEPSFEELEGEALVPASPLEEPEEPDPTACEQVTPLDAEYACLEVIPLGASAWVTLDGMEYGLSPIGVPYLAPGEYTIRLDREGDQPWHHTFALEAGESLRIDPLLAPMPEIVPPWDFLEPYPLAVMVENSPDARPQAGLDLADVVYEALAEGGISRFLAVYMTRDAEVIGPVRSTRHYFVYSAAEYNATLVHVGASPIGYAALAATGIRNVNESYGDVGIWRSTRRHAPHNAYTGTLEAYEGADLKGPGGPGSWGPLVFKDPLQVVEAPGAAWVGIWYPPGGWYSVEYLYDPVYNAYFRYMDGLPHLDYLTGEQLVATNVVIQVVPDEVIDREGRLDMAQTGWGPATFFVDGRVIEGSWTKADYGSQTFFWDTAGNLVRLNPGGTTWIQLVPEDATVAFE